MFSRKFSGKYRSNWIEKQARRIQKHLKKITTTLAEYKKIYLIFFLYDDVWEFLFRPFARKIFGTYSFVIQYINF